MRYELADYEWVVIKPMLPNRPRGVPGGKTIGASSTASSGSSDLERLGAICRIILALTRPAITVPSVGGGLVLGPHHGRACFCP
jgi:transposase